MADLPARYRKCGAICPEHGLPCVVVDIGEGRERRMARVLPITPFKDHRHADFDPARAPKMHSWEAQ